MAISRLYGLDVVRVFEFAQVSDEISGTQPDHVLKTRERERVIVGQAASVAIMRSRADT